MLPLPLILTIMMAGAVLVIMFLLVQHLGKQEKDLGKHTLDMSSLKEDLAQKDEEVKKTSAIKEQLQQEELRTSKEEADNLRKELAAQDKPYQDLKARCDQLERQLAENKDMTAQLEQQKKQFMEQVIKCKKLEQDLQVRQDEITKLEQINRALEREKQEQEQQKIALPGKTKGAGEDSPPRDISEAVRGGQEENEGRQTKQEEQRPEEPKGEQEKKPESPFKRFLKPKISEKSQEEEHKSEDPREPGQ